MPQASHRRDLPDDAHVRNCEIHDLINTLHKCMLRLDALGAPLEAAHLDTCVQNLTKAFILDATMMHRG